MSVLQINGLHKTYGKITAVNNLNLTVEPGNIYGILGPNGSGKTTTLGMVLGITQPDAGTFTWFDGRYGDDHRRYLGALLETPNFYPYLSAYDNLKIVAKIKRVPSDNLLSLLELVNLKQRALYKFQTFSLGMKQRLAIAAAMVGDPEVLIFDEPANGLDPQGIAEIRETIQEIGRTGKTIIMSSHILDEVEKVCTHVCIIKNGNLLAVGPIGSILSNDLMVEVGSDDPARLREFFTGQNFVTSIEERPDHLLITVEEGTEAAQINRLAFQHGLTLSRLAVKKRNLEEEFLTITRDV